MAPYDIVSELGKVFGYLVFLVIGMGFGAVLEMSGFGDSRKLAAQFYFKDMTVLKVMFTGIVVAMTLIFLFSGLGWLEFDRLWVNPTYLWPGIIGGIIMGFGFIIGGFCPGTSIVALATLKVDGFFFAAGVAVGAFTFGETVSIFQGFHNDSFLGRFILPELLGLDTGIVVLLIVLMALVMFYWAEIGERIFGRRTPWKEIVLKPRHRGKIIAATALVVFALLVMLIGQPTVRDKWNRIEDTESRRLENREVYVHPGELLELMNDPLLYTRIFDVRDESDYNLFHLEDARLVSFDDLLDRNFIKKLKQSPANTVIVLTSNGEYRSTEAYKFLRAQQVLNVYILSGGLNHWLSIFPPEAAVARKNPAGKSEEAEELLFAFNRAVGDTIAQANPARGIHKETIKLEFERKVVIRKKKAITGGCG